MKDDEGSFAFSSIVSELMAFVSTRFRTESPWTRNQLTVHREKMLRWFCSIGTCRSSAVCWPLDSRRAARLQQLISTVLTTTWLKQPSAFFACAMRCGSRAHIALLRQHRQRIPVILHVYNTKTIQWRRLAEGDHCAPHAIKAPQTLLSLCW